MTPKIEVHVGDWVIRYVRRGLCGPEEDLTPLQVEKVSAQQFVAGGVRYWKANGRQVVGVETGVVRMPKAGEKGREAPKKGNP